VNERINPYLHQRRLRWRNRIDGWRAAPAEPLFHACVLAALLLMLGWLLLQGLRSHGELMIATMQAHVGALAVAAFLLGWIAAHRRLRRQRHTWQRGWLAAQPISEHAHRRALARVLLPRFAAALLALATVWLAAMPSGARPSLLPFATIASALAMGLLLGWWRDRPVTGTTTAGDAGAVTFLARAGRGTLWRWQRAALHGARRGAALAPGIWLLLLLPMGSYPLLLVPVLLIIVFGLSAFAAAWRLSLQVIVDAAHWLAPQPWPSRQFLRASLPLPLALLGVFVLLLLPLAAALGVAVTLALALLVIAMAVLQLLATAAARGRPSQIVPLTLLHIGLLLACLSALAPAAPLLWLLQLSWLSRKALQ
jgi:hypothetical protein